MSPPINFDGSEIQEATIDGQDVSEITIDGQQAADLSGIPDSDIYLQDDWGDNKLQNRDGSGTTTYNGVTGVYRPEWTIRDTAPSVSGGELIISDGNGITTGINLDLSQTITWEWTDVDVSSHGKFEEDELYFALFAEQTRNDTNGRVHRSYALRFRRGIVHSLIKVDNSGTFTQLIGGGSQSGAYDVSVTRSSTGTWELFDGSGTSLGTANDTAFTRPSDMPVTCFTGSVDGTDLSISEVKVS